MKRIPLLILSAVTLLTAATAQDRAQDPTAAAVKAQPAGFDQEHKVFDKLLHDFVHEGGFVDYKGLAKRRSELDTYLKSLEAVTPLEFAKWTDSQRQALWINAYNAYTIRLILDNYPVDSIKDLGGLFSSVFSKEIIPLQRLASVDKRSEAGGSDPLSLGEVEHDLLAKISKKPLFHFAIVCASWSCPQLRNEAYTGDKLEKQLAAQARQFLSDTRKNDIHIRSGKLRVSKIFDWAEDELDGYPGGIRALLKDFAPESVTGDPAFAKAKLKYRDYDWSINEWQSPTGTKE